MRLNTYGIPFGVISLESFFPKPEGHIKYAASFDFPVLYHTVRGATADRPIRERARSRPDQPHPHGRRDGAAHPEKQKGAIGAFLD
ncbi:hypothetical protein [Denitromonas halophila]|uniref:hypothetical protein n=1 Tax=Denitromonas halophila TaxID=1629404 RepID=UPI001C8FBB5E|nr:hypothetical protein [Denitromonas halophila]